MDRDLGGRLSCVVCGIETRRHSGWFLVAENRWLDRLKILAWHPMVARQPRVQKVCGEEHLKTLLTHWLMHADLQFFSTGSCPATSGGSVLQTHADYSILSAGRVVGELAVHRESRSRVWTGSPEALECILHALTGGMKERPVPPTLPWLNRRTGSPTECVLH